jgi:lipopolysaccharide/colanic/teichoic acid biosynthesis glycosyltransferase
MTTTETRDDRVRPAPRREAAKPVGAKEVLDFVLALVLAVPAAPLVLLAAAVVKLTSRGPVIYAQSRVGLNGRVFTIYKLRTMYHNCEAASGAKWATKGDPRVTPVGRFLRATHLDELPQLWNVLKGDMSLVGPRPERPEFVGQLDAQIGRYSERLRVRPGVTGLAQVQLPGDTDLDSVRRKLVYDLYYVERAGLWLDVRLVVCTGFKVLHLPFALSRRVLGIPSGPAVEGVEVPAAFDDPLPAPEPVPQPVVA